MTRYRELIIPDTVLLSLSQEEHSSLSAYLSYCTKQAISDGKIEKITQHYDILRMSHVIRIFPTPGVDFEPIDFPLLEG